MVCVCVCVQAAATTWPSCYPWWRCSSEYEGSGGAGENDQGLH